MNRLERLRNDVATAINEAYDADDHVGDACITVVDEFCAEYEVVEVENWGGENNSSEYWARNIGCNPPSAKHITILHPRKVPTLLEAAEGILSLRNEVMGEHAKKGKLFAALAAAIRKERDK